jgi:hypothetical protein
MEVLPNRAGNFLKLPFNGLQMPVRRRLRSDSTDSGLELIGSAVILLDQTCNIYRMRGDLTQLLLLGFR